MEKDLCAKVFSLYKEKRPIMNPLENLKSLFLCPAMYAGCCAIVHTRRRQFQTTTISKNCNIEITFFRSLFAVTISYVLERKYHHTLDKGKETSKLLNYSFSKGFIDTKVLSSFCLQSEYLTQRSLAIIAGVEAVCCLRTENGTIRSHGVERHII